MRTIETQVFTYDELSEDAKEKARNWWCEVPHYDDWAESVLEDAKNIGLVITEFDLDRRGVKASFKRYAELTAVACTQEHGAECETYKDSEQFLLDLKTRHEAMESAIAALKESGDPDDKIADVESAFDGWLEDREAEYLHDMSENYRIMLNREYEYVTSDDYVEEAIRANEYEFTIDGKIH